MRLFYKPRMDFFITFIIFIISGGVSASYAQSNDAYLDALQDEASSLSLDNNTSTKGTSEFNPTSSNKTISTSTLIAESGLPAGLDFNTFIATLKANYFGRSERASCRERVFRAV